MNILLTQTQFSQNTGAYASSPTFAQGASLGRLVELVRPFPHWHVLDIATGAGHTALAFAPLVATVTAVDLTPAMLHTAATLVTARGISNLHLVEASATQMPFTAAQFDLVTCRLAAHHFPSVAQFLREASRLLRPGGQLALTDIIVPGSRRHGKKATQLRQAGEYVNAFEQLRDPSHHRDLSQEEWQDALRLAGFRVVAEEIRPLPLDFDDYADRMRASPANKQRLRAMLLQAPEPVTRFLTPLPAGDRINFRFTEAIFVCFQDNP